MIKTKHRIARRTAFVAALSISALALMVGSASAEECLLDTNNNGVPDALDTDGGATSTGANTLACGENATAAEPRSTAIGADAIADPAIDGDPLVVGAPLQRATAVGSQAEATNHRATATGAQATASGIRATATGSQADASGDLSTATGTRAIASGGRSTANGADAVASGDLTTAVGSRSQAVNGRSVAIGADAVADPTVNGDPALDLFRATAVGSEAQALNHRATAVGSGAVAGGRRSTALGTDSVARGGGSIAVGDNAQTGTPGAGANNAIAVGRNTNAQATGSVAIGTDSGDVGAVATLENEFVLGTANHTYTARGITSDASLARQDGPLELVTTDAEGHLASDGGEIFNQLGEHGSGIAIAMAVENPDLVGNETFGLSANVGFFEGNSALGIAAMGVLGHDFMGGGERWALSGGVGFSLNEKDYGGHSTDRTVGGRAGVQVSW
jgi:trimeric autotransporter adhesin